MKHLSICCFLLCGLIGLTSAAVSRKKVANLAKRWAPLLKLAKGEKWNPSSVDYFLRHVKMIGCGCQPNPITSNNLEECSSDSYLTTKTKLKCAKCTNPRVLRGQKPSQVPVYTMYREQGQYLDIIYWVFFPYNRGKKVCIGYMFRNNCLGKNFSFGHHVGDWEHVTVRFKNYKVYSMYLSIHDSKITKKYGGEFLWNGKLKIFQKGSISLRMYRTHAIVYAAKGSHGMWSSAGVHTYKRLPNNARLQDKCSSGTSWYTWRHLKIFKYQSNGQYSDKQFRFVQYKGRWGNKKRDCVNLPKPIGKTVCVLNSGPSGPAQKSFVKSGDLG